MDDQVKGEGGPFVSIGPSHSEHVNTPSNRAKNGIDMSGTRDLHMCNRSPVGMDIPVGVCLQLTASLDAAAHALRV